MFTNDWVCLLNFLIYSAFLGRFSLDQLFLDRFFLAIVFGWLPFTSGSKLFNDDSVRHFNLSFCVGIFCRNQRESHSKAGSRGSTMLSMVLRMDPPFCTFVFIALWELAEILLINLRCGFSLLTCLSCSFIVPLRM